MGSRDPGWIVFILYSTVQYIITHWEDINDHSGSTNQKAVASESFT